MPLVIVSVVVAHVLCARHRRAAEAIDAQVFAEHPAAVSGLGEHPVCGPLLLPRWEQLVLERPVLVATMAPLPEPDRVHAAAGQRQGQRPRAALVRRVPRRGRTRGAHRRGGRSSPHRGLQTVAGAAAGTKSAAVDTEHHRAPALASLITQAQPALDRLGTARRAGSPIVPTS